METTSSVDRVTHSSNYVVAEIAAPHDDRHAIADSVCVDL